jgi:polyvinyl alcohol dehydrogenase (cytochrome)
MHERGVHGLCVLGLCVVVGTSGAAGLHGQANQTAGEDVYKKYCAVCHDQVNPRIPARDVLRKMTAARILRTLDFGLMMSIAYPMRRDEREAVAMFLGTNDRETGTPPTAFCRADQPMPSLSPEHGWNGWSPTPANLRFQSSAEADLTALQVRDLKLKWAFGFKDDVTAFGAPTVLDGTLFVGSASGTVHAMDAATGCLRWIFQANGPVRSAMVAVGEGANRTLVFGDQIGWVYALDARAGTLRWKHRVDEHEATRLTGSPAAYDDLVFVPAASWEETRALAPEYPCCTFRGSVTALRVGDGSTAWKTYVVDRPRRTGMTKAGTNTFGPSGAGIWSAPTVDVRRGTLYVTTGDNYSHPATTTSDAVLALDLKTGRIVWSQQTTPKDVYNSSCAADKANCPPESGPDYDFGASAMLVATPNGKDLLVAGQKSGVVYALDPDRQGTILWQTRVGKGGGAGGVQWGMASDGKIVYAAVSDAVTISGAYVDRAPLGNATFDPVKGGGLTALDVETGKSVWFAPGHPCNPPRPGCSPAQSAALTLIPGVVFSSSIDGHIRAYSTDDGAVMWDFDTVRTYDTVNGVQGKGGSIDGAGPVVVNGLVFVNSGYPRNGGMAGNVLLAFGVEK